MAEIRYWKGKGKWCQHLLHPDRKFDPNGKYHIQFYPDEAALNEIMTLKETKDGITGIMNTIKKDEDGPSVNIGRPAQRNIKGQLVAFTPPEMLDKDGKPCPGTPIGNGSDVTIKVEVRTYSKPDKSKGKALRLAAVRIDNLVPYTQESYFPEQKKQVAGLADQPVPIW